MNKTTRLLLVEDDETDAEVVTRALKRPAQSRYEIQIARTLAVAFRQLCDASYDLILLDLGLPDGLELNGLGKMVKMLDIPVIVLTGNENQSLAEKAILQGAHDFIPKSENLDLTLDKTIRFAIQRHQTQAKLARTESLLEAQHEFSKFQAARIQRRLDDANKLAAFVKNSTQCIAVVDASGTIEWANRAFHTFCQIDDGQLMRMTLQELPVLNKTFWLSDVTSAIADVSRFSTTRTVDCGRGGQRVFHLELSPIAQTSSGHQCFTFSILEHLVSMNVGAGAKSPGDRSFAMAQSIE